MSEVFVTSKQTNAALIAAAQQAFGWSGVFPAACLPGRVPLSQGALAQSEAQMVRDFKRHKKSLVGLRSSSKGLAILVRNVPVGVDRPSELARRFFDPERYLVTRTKTVDLAESRITLIDTVVIKSPFGFPLGMRTKDPSIVLVPDDSWALFSTAGETVIGFQRASLAMSLQQLDGGTFTNRDIMELSPDDWAALLGRDAA